MALALQTLAATERLVDVLAERCLGMNVMKNFFGFDKPKPAAVSQDMLEKEQDVLKWQKNAEDMIKLHTYAEVEAKLNELLKEFEGDEYEQNNKEWACKLLLRKCRAINGYPWGVIGHIEDYCSIKHIPLKGTPYMSE
jgi:hypothetical protein